MAEPTSIPRVSPKAREDIEWADFRTKLVDLGGDGFYGAYLPVHREPAMTRLSESVQAHPERYPQWAGVLPDYREVPCPVWERLQPRMMQLKTNYFDLPESRRQADILARAIRAFA